MKKIFKNRFKLRRRSDDKNPEIPKEEEDLKEDVSIDIDLFAEINSKAEKIKPLRLVGEMLKSSGMLASINFDSNLSLLEDLKLSHVKDVEIVICDKDKLITMFRLVKNMRGDLINALNEGNISTKIQLTNLTAEQSENIVELKGLLSFKLEDSVILSKKLFGIVNVFKTFEYNVIVTKLSNMEKDELLMDKSYELEAIVGKTKSNNIRYAL